MGTKNEDEEESREERGKNNRIRYQIRKTRRGKR